MAWIRGILIAVCLCWISSIAPAQPAPTQPAEPAGQGSLAAARQAYQKGEYSLAEEKFRQSMKDAPSVQAAVELARTLRMTGRYRQAVDGLQSDSEMWETSAAWCRATAEALRDVGEYAEALDLAQQADALEPDNAQTILLRGNLLETLGREDDAVAVYARMDRILENDEYQRHAATLTALGEIMDRYAILTGRKASDQARNILHNYFQQAYQNIDPDYWPANLAAGRFLLEKHQNRGAMEEFQLALKRNPNLPEAHAGLGAVDLQKWKFADCLQKVSRALAINPNCPQALCLQAACYMQWRKFDKATEPLEKVLAANPNHIEALSLLAAAYLRQNQPEKAKPFEERIRQINPHCAQLPLTVGYWYAAGRQFDEAKTYLDEAIALAPKQADPLAVLGELYMQIGEEEKAREVLQRARQLDDYRQDVGRYLQIATRLKHFEVKESEHFIVKVDPKFDRVLLGPMSAYLESIYDEVTSDYNYAPAEKTIIEVLPNQAEFSARIAGASWVPTVGACTGRVIALAAPSKTRGALGRHNWAQVLRHEFAHTVTLAASGNRIPHWLTEACAVWQQKDKRAFKYVRILTDAVQQNKLIPVKDIDWAFVTPAYPGQRVLAYAQSEWMLDYVICTKGFAALHKMLEAFGDNQPQRDVFQKTLGVSEAEFDKQFRAWAKQAVKEWGFDPAPPINVAACLQESKKHPDSADAYARYAFALLHAGQAGQARQQADKALELSKDNVLALRVLANLHFRAKRYDDVIPLCQRIEKLDPATTTAPELLARCYLAQKDWARAIDALELLQKRQPMDAFSYAQLAKLYTQLGQPEKALPNLIYLHRHTMNDPKYARQIAETYRSMGQAESALAFYREVTYTQPYDPGAYEAMAALHLREKNYDLARAEAENLTLLSPDDAHAWAYLATIRYRVALAKNDLAELQQARAEALKAKELDPASKNSATVLRFIDAAIQKRQNGSL